MLHKFLEENQKSILELTEQKTKKLAGTRGNSEQLKLGLPLFYEQLKIVLEDKLSANPSKDMLVAAAEHGREFLRLGYSLSHVVHAYGAMCQAITELATIKNKNISPSEFNILNGCLDVAIASAVSEFQFESNDASEKREILHLGFLAHELRNALSSATVAQEMIRAGLVGVGGSTAGVLEANLSRMRNLIDRSLSEVRMRADSDVLIEKFRLSNLIDQIVITAQIDANKKSQILLVDVEHTIEIESDRQFILSAIGNLVQNAIKYSKSNSNIWLRGKSLKEFVLIEVEDSCGGIETEKIETLFAPFSQDTSEKSGLGLGLTITRRAVNLCKGTLDVKNTDTKSGCIFSITVPLKLIASPSQKNAVRGKDSVQPNFKK